MITESRARELAANALPFIASDGELVGAMLAASGLAPGDLRQAADRPEFGLFLLDFILQDDGRVLAFAADQAIRPEVVLQARALLARHEDGDDDGWN